MQGVQVLRDTPNNPIMRKFLVCLSVIFVLISYRAYVVLNRPLPDDLQQPNVVRVLDELGRIANFYLKICVLLDVNPASWPIKFIVNNGFGLILNGIYSPNPDVEVLTRKIANVPVKIIRPIKQTKQLPVIIYIHGGGWTWFSTDTYLSYLENLANRTNMVVVGIDYRKAPEYPFPKGYQDCIDVTWQVLAGKLDININLQKVVIAGDGSGGNLAAAVALNFPKKILMQVLINPALQLMDFQTPSYQDNTDVIPGITSPDNEINHWLLYLGQPLAFADFIKANRHVFPTTIESSFDFVNSAKQLPHYLKLTNITSVIPKDHDFVVSTRLDKFITNETISPMMRVNLKGLPNAYVITSQYDVLRDEAVMFTNRLNADGSRVKLNHYKGTFHGFFLFSTESGFFQLNSAKEALQDLVDFFGIKVHDRYLPEVKTV